MSEAAQNERKRRAAERRQRILDGATTRLSRIHGRPVEETPPLSHAAAELPSNEAPVLAERPPTRSDDTRSYAAPRPPPPPAVVEKKKTPRSGSPLETAAVIMRFTQRLQILIASLLAVWHVAFGFQQSSPLSFLFLSEVALISGTWTYLQLVPQEKVRQVQQLRHERACLRHFDGSWIPTFLYRFLGISVFLRTIDDLRFCFRIVYADVAVFVVLCIVLRQLDVLPNAEL